MSHGAPFPCPACGASDWDAHYMVPVKQGVTLLVGDNGEPDEQDFDGCEKSFDPDPTDYFKCLGCGAEITPEGRLMHAPEDAP